MRISDWSSGVCASDLAPVRRTGKAAHAQARPGRLMPEPGVHDAQITGHVDADGQFAQYRGVERHGWSNTVRAASTTSSTRSCFNISIGRLPPSNGLFCTSHSQADPWLGAIATI